MPRSVRDIAIILILIGGGLLILFSYPKKPEGGLLSRGLYTVLGPLLQGVSSAHAQAKHVWQSYVWLIGVREQNEALRKEIRKLRRDKAALLDQESENRRLKKLLDLRAGYEFPSVVAQVVGEDAAGWYRTLFINRGLDEGVRPDMPVTVAEGVVGRVVNSSSAMSRIILLTDPNHSVDCRVARTRDRGILSGSLERGCILRYINLKSGIKSGDEVVTSGLDGIFPRGLPIGKVETVDKGTQGLFLEARVAPVVDFSEIEEVVVVLGQRGGFDIRPGLEDKR
ncbi:MAG: rod shape-determining protein MreC [Desulfomonilaceae bacterium]